MKNEISVYIPEPCHENWNNMLPAEKGRFCNACAKQVIDFSMMSDTQIIDYFKNSTGRVCGRFAEDQLQRSLQPVTQPKKKAWWMAMTMPLLFLFNKSQAQESSNAPDTAAAFIDLTATRTTGLVSIVTVKNNEPNFINVKGKVVDEKGGVIPYASIFCERTGFIIAADSVGNFESETDMISYDDMLRVSSAGFESSDIVVGYLIDNPGAPVVLNPIVMGDVLVAVKRNSYKMGGFTTGVCIISTREKAYSSYKKIIGKEIFTASPNPVGRGSQINIQLKQSGEYSLLLLDNSSRLILSKIINSQDGNNIPLDIPNNIAAGIYYLRAIDEKSKKSFVQKIIIQ